MQLQRISIGLNPSVTLNLPGHTHRLLSHPIMVIGSNGSGKSLAVTGLLAVLAQEEERVKWMELLRDGGLDRIELSWKAGREIIHLVRDLRGEHNDVRRELLPDSVTGNNNHSAAYTSEPTDLLPGRADFPAAGPLFSRIHVVLAGALAVPAGETLREAILQTVCRVSESELAGWMAREQLLAGTAEAAGSLAAAQSETESAAGELQRVESLWAQLDLERERHQELEDELQRIDRNRRVHAAELAEFDRICTLAERARCLETWLREIETEEKNVSALREQHRTLQTRLDVLEEKFRRAPERFPELLDEYAACRARQSELENQFAATAHNREDQQARLRELTVSLDSLTPPPDATEALESAREEAARLNGELTDLLRQRIELVRRREGAHQRRHQEYAPFLELSEESRQALERLTQLDPAELSESPSPPPDARLRERQTRAEDIRALLKEKFAGYENIPATAADRIKVLHQVRSASLTHAADLASVTARREELSGKIRPWVAAVGATATGALGFAAGTYFSAWDVGIVAALAASGLALLGLRARQRRAEADLESAAQAEAMLRKRIAAAAEQTARLEQELDPLSRLKTLDGALARLSEYHRYRAELDGLAFDEERSTAARAALPSAELVEIRRHLPAELSDTPLPIVRRLYESFREAESAIRELDSEWAHYHDGGSRALEIRELEDRVSHLSHRQSELADAFRRERETYERRRAELAAEIAPLQNALARDDQDRLIHELKATRARAAELDAQTSGLLESSDDPELVQTEWRERDTLRVTLRDVRNRLSAFPTHDELRSRQSLLHEEFSEARQKLGARDPLYLHQGSPADYAAKYHAQRRAVQQTIDECDEQEASIRRELDSLDVQARVTALSHEPALDDLRRAVAEREARVEEIGRDLNTTRHLIASIRAERDETVRRLGDDLPAILDRTAAELSDGKFRGVRSQSGEWHAETSDGKTRRLALQSDGTQDLLYLAIRIGILRALSGLDAHPVVWDEPLWRLDEAHLSRVRVALTALCADRQVILLTRQSALEEWGEAVRIGQSAEWSASHL